ncbi:MAG: hypothetical protein E7437_01300 [Ruminococcaceae bacterium]|nr:hypothetical protein [Oscillospiraceae bacterium]
MKSKKSLILAVVALVVAVAVLVTVYFVTRPETSEGGKSFILTVVHSDGTQKAFDYTTNAEFLGDFLVEQGVVEIGDVDDGMFAYADGEKAVYEENGCYWGFYVNGSYATVGLFDTPIEDGTVYELRYEDGSSWS